MGISSSDLPCNCISHLWHTSLLAPRKECHEKCMERQKKPSVHSDKIYITPIFSIRCISLEP